MTTTTYRAFTAKLRAAGWHSYGQGHYRHPTKGGWFACFDAPGGTEIWRWYAERDMTPDPERSQVERHRMFLEEAQDD